MFYNNGLLLLATLAFSNRALANELVLYDLNAFPYARCLDGSPSGYYLRQATSNSTASKFLIILEGGGMCTGREDCTARSKTDLGSSANWSSTFDWNSTSLTTIDPRNHFRSWNTIWVKYCDGSLFTGQRTDNLSQETFDLWFSGHHSINALIDHLSATQNLNASGADTFLAFAGGSAGGLGVFANVDHVAARLPFATTVGVPIGGYVPAIEWFSDGPHHAPANDVRDHAFAHHTHLYASFLPSRCASALKDDSYLCLVPRLAWPYRQQPVFVIEALTDACVLCEFEGVGRSDDTCWVPLVAGGKLRPKSEQTWISAYGRNASQNMAQIIASPRDGLFAPSCFLHCGFTLDHPKINGTMVVDALFSWVLTYLPVAEHPSYPRGVGARSARDFKWVDECAGGGGGQYWPPCNPTCPLVPGMEAERVWVGSQ